MATIPTADAPDPALQKGATEIKREINGGHLEDAEHKMRDLYVDWMKSGHADSQFWKTVGNQGITDADMRYLSLVPAADNFPALSQKRTDGFLGLSSSPEIDADSIKAFDATMANTGTPQAQFAQTMDKYLQQELQQDDAFHHGFFTPRWFSGTYLYQGDAEARIAAIDAERQAHPEVPLPPAAASPQLDAPPAAASPQIDAPVQPPAPPQVDAPVQPPAPPHVDAPVQPPAPPQVDAPVQPPAPPHVDAPAQPPAAPIAQPADTQLSNGDKAAIDARVDAIDGLAATANLKPGQPIFQTISEQYAARAHVTGEPVDAQHQRAYFLKVMKDSGFQIEPKLEQEFMRDGNPKHLPRAWNGQLTYHTQFHLMAEGEQDQMRNSIAAQAEQPAVKAAILKEIQKRELSKRAAQPS